ncbi:MAG: aspartate kinase [Acidobacteriia bacterium]|nr:aspartate kinase [Terriglobia bacterium]
MKSHLRVLKFGGTSLGDAECIRNAVEAVAKAKSGGPAVVVVSAMSGVTSQLLDAATHVTQGKPKMAEDLSRFLLDHHELAIQTLISNRNVAIRCFAELEQIVEGAACLLETFYKDKGLNPSALDGLLGTGEQLSARLFAAALQDRGLNAVPMDASKLIVTNSAHGNADPLMDQSRDRILRLVPTTLKRGFIPVVTGFVGATEEGLATTLGRGGSDYTATIFGAALNAEEIFIWTDVDGVLTADPRSVPEARTIPEITYQEATELACLGAKVLHPKTLNPVSGKQIPVWIRNSFNPTASGTRIGAQRKPVSRGIRAVTCRTDVSLIRVRTNARDQFLSQAVRTLAAPEKAIAQFFPSSTNISQDELLFVAGTEEIEASMRLFDNFKALAPRQMGLGNPQIDTEIALVSIVGNSLDSGTSRRALKAMSRSDIQPRAEVQGLSKNNLCFVVPQESARRTLAAFHREFFENTGDD